MRIEDFLNQKIIVTQVKGDNKLTAKQKGNLIGLGLRGINTKSELVCSNSVLGMVRKAQHLLQVSKA